VAIGRKVIAIIDDDPWTRDGLSHLLTALGYSVEVYASGEQFIDAALNSEAGCLLVDIHLGDITGIELVRELLTMSLAFAVIFMTGSQDATFRRQAMELECVAFLHKPLPENQLVKAVAEAIG